jgi:hypothetical protein
LEVVALGLAALFLQAAGREGTVTGTLTLNGATTPLSHVYASAQPGAFDKKTEDVRVLLSDVPLDDDTRADTFALIHLARDGKARIVEVVIDASGAPISGSIFAKPFDGMVSVTGMHKFTRERLERTAIAGSLAMDTTHEFMGVTFRYEAHFIAPIPRPPTAEERAAALRSPPARAAAEYVAAVRLGQLSGFLATLTASAAADYQKNDAAGRLRELHAGMPPDTHVTDLTPQVDGTVLVDLSGRRPSDGMMIGYTIRMVLENGSWKVGQ